MPKATQQRREATILDDLPFCIVRAAIGFHRLNECILRQVGLRAQPLGAGTVLHALYEQDDCTVKDLANRTQIPNGTLTGILDRLERDGLVRRAENAADGRSWRIKLTATGQGVRKQLMQRHEIALQFFDAIFSPRESARLKRDLIRLTVAMRYYASASEDGYEVNIRPGTGSENKRKSKPRHPLHEYI